MRKTKKLFATILCGVLMTAQGYGQGGDSFKIGSGDRLNVSISVQGSLRDLSRISLFLPIQIVGESVFSTFQLTVGPDGMVSIPSVDIPIRVAGLSVPEAEAMISSKLGLSSKGKSVSINVAQVESHPFYVWGAVVQPGRYTLSRPISLVEGLSMAGGPILTANLKKVFLVRAGENGRLLNLSNRSIKENGLPALELKEQDTIIVPKKWTADMSVWFLILTIVGTAASVAIATRN